MELIKHGNNEETKTISLNRIKVRELYITPNKPVLTDYMVPVKYVKEANDAGYWVITKEDDSTWYSYDNRKWANAMIMDDLVVEGNIKVTNENKLSLVGRKVTTTGSMFVWIPRYAAVASGSSYEVEFLYSSSNYYIDENYDRKNISNLSGYELPQGLADSIPGFWISKFVADTKSQNASNGNIGAQANWNVISQLSKSIYGNLSTVSNIWITSSNYSSTGNVYGVFDLTSNGLGTDSASSDLRPTITP